MAAITFTITLVPGVVWIAGDDVTPAKLNLTASPTAGVVMDSGGAGEGAVMVYLGGAWQPSATPSPATAEVYLGGDGAWHNVAALTAPAVSLFNYMHFI